MTDTERDLFHKNYAYMWHKLNTTHYFVKGLSFSAQADNTKSRIKGGDLLPAYSICSKCMSEKYEPSNKTVMKIVMFYNQNLSPETSVEEFLHKDLSLTDDFRHSNKSLLDKRFIGTYYGYYIASSTSTDTLGAVLKIYEENSILKAALVTGIRSDDELFNDAIKDLFQNNPVTKAQFDHYYNSRSIDNRRCYFYEGIPEITMDSVFIVFRGCDEEARKLVFTLNITSFPARLQRAYLGGLAFMLLSSDSPFDTRFYQMGLINSENGTLSLNDNRISELLEIHTEGKDVWLSSKRDRTWYELAIELG